MEKTAHFIKLESPDDRLPTVCERTSRCYKQGKTVTIHASDEEQAGELEELLWVFRQNAFVPHGIAGKIEEPVIEPVIIQVGEGASLDSEVVIVASGEQPDGVESCEVLYDFAEVYDEALRKRSRERFKAYQQAGWQMKFID